jgi:hypothetical protein
LAIILDNKIREKKTSVVCVRYLVIGSRDLCGAEMMDGVWEEHSGGRIASYTFLGGGQPSGKVAIFNLQMVELRLQNTFERLQELFCPCSGESIDDHGNRYHREPPEPFRFVLFFTKLPAQQSAVEEVMREIGIPGVAFVCYKALDGLADMFTLYKERFNITPSVRPRDSIYVGPAANMQFCNSTGLSYLYPKGFCNGSGEPIGAGHLGKL